MRERVLSEELSDLVIDTFTASVIWRASCRWHVCIAGRCVYYNQPADQVTLFIFDLLQIQVHNKRLALRSTRYPNMALPSDTHPPIRYGSFAWQASDVTKPDGWLARKSSEPGAVDGEVWMTRRRDLSDQYSTCEASKGDVFRCE